MAKLPKSRRPDRRKPSDTFNHPYQRDVFAPPLVSSLGEIGIVARIVVGLFVPIVIAYVTTSNSLPDESPIKRVHYDWAFRLTGICALLAFVEFMRTMRLLDTERLGRFPKYALIVVTLCSAAFLFFAIGNLAHLHSIGHEQRLNETQRREDEIRRKQQELEQRTAECVEQRDREVESATKRRSWFNAEHKRCVQEFEAKPKGIFSKETTESHCASQKSALDRAERGLKSSNSRICATGSIKP
jgi:hypothetical protein